MGCCKISMDKTAQLWTFPRNALMTFGRITINPNLKYCISFNPQKWLQQHQPQELNLVTAFRGSSLLRWVSVPSWLPVVIDLNKEQGNVTWMDGYNSVCCQPCFDFKLVSFHPRFWSGRLRIYRESLHSQNCVLKWKWLNFNLVTVWACVVHRYPLF